MVMRVWLMSIACWLAMVTHDSLASPQWLEDVRSVERDGQAGIELVLSQSVFYLSHFPPESGDALTVYLRVPALNNDPALPVHEDIKPRAGAEFPLAQVTFDANESETTLRLTFTQKTDYRISQGSNDKTILVMFVPSVPVSTPIVSAVEDERIKALLAQSRDALTRAEVDKAIQIISAVISLPANPYRADALELLGVARERKGQKAHAKAAYEQFLTEFPKGEGADRVGQRLAELLSSDLKPQEKLKAIKTAAPSRAWTHNGSFGQFYYYGRNDLGGGVAAVDQSMLLTQFAWNSQQRGERFDSRVVANMSHQRDFLGVAKDPEINSLYGQVKDKQAGWFAKLGRQSSPGGGVSGRFDGLLAQYNLTSTVRLDAITGYTVEFAEKSTLQIHRPFLSVATNLGPYWDGLEVMPYYIRQSVDGMLERTATGYELRYLHPRGNLFNVVDYDLLYDLLNAVLLQGQYSFLESSSVYGYYDARRSPPVATTNALIGETIASSLKDLLAQYTRSQIHELARTWTGESTTVTVGASHTFSPRVQLSGDVTLSEQKFPFTTGEAGTLIATQTDRQAYYALQMVTSQLMNTHDTLLVGLQHTQADTYNSNSLTLAHRFPFEQAWRFDARLRVDQRANDNGQRLNKTTPTVRIEYRPSKTVETQLEFGGEWWGYSGTPIAGQTAQSSYRRLTASLGYQWLF
jgi:hypothetical protein